MADINSSTLMEKVVSLCKRRGFVYPSSEIYGGLANVWDFGPTGTLLKNNIRDLWWKHFVLDRDDVVGIDASAILRPEIWSASGHISGFNEAMLDCKECRNRVRADHLIEDVLPDLKVEGMDFSQLDKLISEKSIKCPKCGKSNWTKTRKFSQLVEVKIGVLEEGKDLAYLRGEIAQGIFVNFKNVINSTRVKIPFGIAQVGKAYRNEITMGQFIHRTFEFDLMEFEYFIKPENWEEIYESWRNEMWSWALGLGIREENLRWREHEEFERSFYSKKTMDIEYKYPFGWKEMWGIAYRTDYDLINHSKMSGKDLSYPDPATGKSFIPHVIEPTFGLSRLTGIILFDSYSEDGERVVLKIDPKIAPYKVAIFPLLANKGELVDKAKDIYHKLKTEYSAVFDDRGNIGKRYFAQDEIGTPWCITVDFETLKDGAVTVRDRDTAKQERVSIAKLNEWIREKLKD